MEIREVKRLGVEQMLTDPLVQKLYGTLLEMSKRKGLYSGMRDLEKENALDDEEILKAKAALAEAKARKQRAVDKRVE